MHRNLVFSLYMGQRGLVYAQVMDLQILERYPSHSLADSNCSIGKPNGVPYAFFLI